MRAWRFYAGEGTDHRGRTMIEILGWDDQTLEEEHDYIQWLFPLTEPSGANPHAPLLSIAETAAFREAPEVQARVVTAFRRMLRFYGLEMQLEAGTFRVLRSNSFPSRARNWITPFNHNFLRVTRILKSLGILGLMPLAAAFFECLEEIYRGHASTIGATTFGYWRDAVQGQGNGRDVPRREW